MINVGINGACGRMGAMLLGLVSEEPDMQLAAALERSDHPALGQDAGTATQQAELGVTVSDKLPDGVDVLIDFSAPESTTARAAECGRAGAAMVIGTTGLDSAQMAAVRDAARNVPVLMAPNMSVGVNLVFDIAGRMAGMLGDAYNVEIVETHHNQKVDAPSGTALRIGEKIAEALGRDLESCAVHGRKGRVGKRTTEEIGFHAVRAGDVVGEHRVIFGTPGETIELIHRAQTRETFARGALRAARIIVGQSPGIYGFELVLK